MPSTKGVITTDSTFGTLSEGPLIARGAFGVVRLCHSSTRGLCAVKFIPLPSEESWVAAQREARALELASGPYTVELLGLIRLEPSPQRPVPLCLLLMNYLSGGTLSSLASNWRPTTGRGLPIGLLRRFTRKIVEAVAHVHALGMAHRDIKGANLLLAPETQSVKLADFGSCKLPADACEDLDGEGAAVGSASPGFSMAGGGKGVEGFPAGRSSRPVTAIISSKGVQQARGGGGGGGAGRGAGASPAPSSPRGEVGTIAWMAPEVVKRGLGDSGSAAPSSSPTPTSLAFWQAADIWGLGATVLELLTGRPPWHGEAEEASEIMLCIASTDLRDKLPQWGGAAVTGFLRACLHPDPSMRPPASELLYTPFLFGDDFKDDEEEDAGDSPTLPAVQQRERASSRPNAAVVTSPKQPLQRAKPSHHASTPAALCALLQSLGSLPPSAMKGALASCDSLKSEVRLSCRQVQHWFAGLHSRAGESPSTEWVTQCLFSEERVPLGEYAEGFAAASAMYGAACTARVQAACASSTPAFMHRECAASILFGAAADTAWTFKVEAALLLGSLAALPPSEGSCGLLAFVLHLVEARLSCWEHAGVPLGSSCLPLDERATLGLGEEEARGGGAGGGSGEDGARATLGGIAVAMQWLATARVRLSARAQAADAARKEAEEDAEEAEEAAHWGGEGAAAAAAAAAAAVEDAQQSIGITVPDFAVLFYTRVNVWVAELSTTLRALNACCAWWGEAVASASAQEVREFNVHALAHAHQQLTRKAYSRLIAVRKCWDFSKGAVGFGAASPRKGRGEEGKT